jgi:anaerobic magnesium-protoporphyrin IX monomethyl ester cyclase
MARAVLVGPEIEENLSLRYLSGFLKKHGHEAVIVPFNGWAERDTVVRKILSENPGIVGLSMSFQYRGEDFIGLAEQLRRKGLAGHVTAGGHFATFAFHEILDSCLSIDSIIRLSGEVPLLGLAEALDRGRDWRTIPSMAFRHPSQPGDTVVNAASDGPGPALTGTGVWPDRCGPRRRHLSLNAAPLIAGQGCWGHCSFCSIHAFRKLQGKKGISFRDTRDVAAEMAWLYHEHDVRVFVFQDDNLFTGAESRNLERLDDLERGLADGGVDPDAISLAVKCRPESITDALLEKLTALGTVRVFTGIEAMSERGLGALDRRLTVEGNLEALERLGRFGIYPCYNILLFNPWTTLEEIRENIANLRRAPSHMPFNVCRTEIYHGTPLFERLSREGRLSGSFMQPNYECADPQAEAMLRIMEPAFSHRSYDFHGSVNEAMSLGYEMSLALRHYASVQGLRALESRVRTVIRDTNAETLSLLEEMADFVGGAPRTKRDVEDFALAFAIETARMEERELAAIARAHADLEEGVLDLQRRRQQRLRERFRVERTSWAAVPALALALETASCGMSESPAKPGAEETSGFSLERFFVGEAQAATKKTKKDKKKKKEKKSAAIKLESTFIPGTTWPHSKVPKYGSGFLLVENEPGGIPEDVDILVEASSILKVTPLISPDRKRMMIEIYPAKEKNSKQKCEVAVVLSREGKQVSKLTETFWMYDDSKFSHGKKPVDEKEAPGPMVMDPVPPMSTCFDLTAEKNVDICFEPHSPWYGGTYDEKSKEITFGLATDDGFGNIKGGIYLTAKVKLDPGQSVVSVDIQASDGKIEKSYAGKGNQAFTFVPPRDEKTGQLEGGTFTIDVKFTVKNDATGKQVTLKGRGKLRVEPGGDFVLEVYEKIEKNKGGFDVQNVRSLPRNLMLAIAVVDEHDGAVTLRTALHRKPGSGAATDAPDLLRWDVSSGTVEPGEKGLLTWKLPSSSSSGVHRLTLWARDDEGGLSVASYFRIT